MVYRQAGDRGQIRTRDDDICNVETNRFELRVWSPGEDPVHADPLYVVTGDLGGGQIKIPNG